MQRSFCYIVILILAACTIHGARVRLSASEAIEIYQDALQNASITTSEPVLLTGPVGSSHARFLLDTIEAGNDCMVLVGEAEELTGAALAPGAGATIPIRLVAVPEVVRGKSDGSSSSVVAYIVELRGLRPGRLYAVFVVPTSEWDDAISSRGLNDLVSDTAADLSLSVIGGRMDLDSSWSELRRGAVRFLPQAGHSPEAEQAAQRLAALLHRRVIGRPHGSLPPQRSANALKILNREGEQELVRAPWEQSMDTYSPPLLFRTHCNTQPEPPTDQEAQQTQSTEDACPPHIVQMAEAAARGDGPAPVHRMVVTSCDRYVEDHDEGLWIELLTAMPELDAAAQPARARGAGAGREAGAALWSTAFMEGDNVYMDWAAAYLLAQNVSREPHELRGAYRAFYRASYSRPLMRRFMRRGAHSMVGDDHEAVNNLNRWMDAAGTDHPLDSKGLLEGLAVSHHAGSKVSLKSVVRAAREVFAEYQLALTSPWRTSEWLAARRGGEVVAPVVLHLDASPTEDSRRPRQEEQRLNREAGGVRLPQSTSSIMDSALLAGTRQKGKPSGQATETATSVDGPSSFFSMWLGPTVVLQVDTRWQRSFLPDPLSPFIGRQQIAHAASVLAAAEQSGAVRDVVIPTSVPMMWMGYKEADVAYYFENDEYATYRHNLPSSIALLELVSASSKVSYLIGGDVHCASRNAVCRTDWDELRAAKKATELSQSGASSTLMDASSGLRDEDVVPGDPDAGLAVSALQRFLGPLLTAERTPIADARSFHLQAFVLLADSMATPSFWAYSERSTAAVCSKCLRTALRPMLSHLASTQEGGLEASDVEAFTSDSGVVLSSKLLDAIGAVQLDHREKRFVMTKLAAHACLRAFVLGKAKASPKLAMPLASLPDSSRCVAHMVSSGSTTKSTSLTSKVIIAFNSLLQHGGPVRAGPWEAEGSFHPSVNTITMYFDQFVPRTGRPVRPADDRGTGLVSWSGVATGRGRRSVVSVPAFAQDGQLIRYEESSARFVRLDWYEEQDRVRGVSDGQPRRFGVTHGQGGWNRLMSGFWVAVVETIRNGLASGVWGVHIDPRDSLIGHGGTRRPEAVGLFEERSCNALVPSGDPNGAPQVSQLGVPVGSSVEIGTAGNLSAVLAVSAVTPSRDPRLHRVWCECGASGSGNLQYAACHRATPTAEFALIRLLQVRGDLAVVAVCGMLGCIALSVWAAALIAQHWGESVLMLLFGGPISLAWKVFTDPTTVVNALIGTLLVWGVWLLVGWGIVVAVPAEWLLAVRVSTPWASLVLMRLCFWVVLGGTSFLLAVMVALDLAGKSPDVGGTATVVVVAGLVRGILWLGDALPVQGALPSP